jgi:hypothetical protein
MRTVIARWESKRAKDWVQVYEQSFSDGVAGYGYDTSNGGGWSMAMPTTPGFWTIRGSAWACG